MRRVGPGRYVCFVGGGADERPCTLARMRQALSAARVSRGYWLFSAVRTCRRASHPEQFGRNVTKTDVFHSKHIRDAAHGSDNQEEMGPNAADDFLSSVGGILGYAQTQVEYLYECGASKLSELTDDAVSSS